MNTTSTPWEYIAAAITAIVALIAAFFINRARTAPVVPVAPAPSETQVKSEEKAAVETKQAEVVRDYTIDQAKKEHEVLIHEKDQDLDKKSAGLLKDPEALNKELLDVGKQVRNDGGS